VPLHQRLEWENKAELLVWKLEETESELRNSLQLSRESENRLMKMKSEAHRKSFLGIRRLLKISGYEDKSLYYDDQGKPFLSDGTHISISHSGQYCCILSSSKFEVGVDIECHQQKILRIASRFCNSAEALLLKRNDDIEGLTLIWGFKECVYKILNQKGISFKEEIRVLSFPEKDSLGAGKTLNGSFAFEHLLIDNYSLVLTHKL
jgi:4'-phosphopantetheinyl transferase